MPKPTRDYALSFARDIEKLDARIAKLQSDRSKLVQAYALITGDENRYGLRVDSENGKSHLRSGQRKSSRRPE
jgi:hypothetical protein